MPAGARLCKARSLAAGGAPPASRSTRPGSRALARGIGWRPATFHLDRSGARGAWGRGGRKRARLRRLCLGDPHVDRPGEPGSRKRARLRRLCRRRAHGLRRAAGGPPRAGRRALGPRPARSLHLRAPSPLRAPGPARPAAAWCRAAAIDAAGGRQAWAGGRLLCGGSNRGAAKPLPS